MRTTRGRGVRHEGGLTLVELLVMVIITVLSAIAVPVRLSQRQQSYDTTAKSDLQVQADRPEALMVGRDSYGSRSG